MERLPRLRLATWVPSHRMPSSLTTWSLRQPCTHTTSTSEGSSGAIFLVRDSGVGGSAIGFLVANRSAVVSLLSFVCLFLGFHTLGLYVHNDVMQALGSPEKQLALLPVFAEWLQLAHGWRLPGSSCHSAGPTYNYLGSRKGGGELP